MTKPYSDCAKFRHCAREYRKRFDAQGKEIKNPPIETPLDYAIDRTMYALKRAIEQSGCEKQYAENLQALQIEHAQRITIEVGKEKKEVLYRDKDGRYAYSAEAQLAMSKGAVELLKAMDTTEITFEAYIVSSVPPDLTFEQVEMFRGIVIPADYQIAEPNAEPIKSEAL